MLFSRVCQRYCQIIGINPRKGNISHGRLTKKQAVNIDELYVGYKFSLKNIIESISCIAKSIS